MLVFASIKPNHAKPSHHVPSTCVKFQLAGRKLRGGMYPTGLKSACRIDGAVIPPRS